MLGVIRPNTYHANMRPLQSEFYDFCEREDELAAPLIAKSIRRLLRKAPSLIARQNEIVLQQQELSNSLPEEDDSKWPLRISSHESEDRLFHSDSSLSSNTSSLSSDSSCASYSSFSSRSSLSEMTQRRKWKRGERNVEVVLPSDMMNRLVRDVVRMVEGESHGIRGCQLQVEFTDSETQMSVSVGKINCDPKILPCCLVRIHLVSIPPPPEAHGSQVLLNRLLGSTSHNLYIKAGYTLEKKKLKPATANISR